MAAAHGPGTLPVPLALAVAPSRYRIGDRSICLRLASRPLCKESSSVSFFVILSRPVVGWGVAVRPRTVDARAVRDLDPRPAIRVRCRSPQSAENIQHCNLIAGLPRCNRIAGHRPHPFSALFPPSRELQCVRPVDRNDKSTPAPDPVATVRPDTTRVSNTHAHAVANCTAPIPPRFTPHQK